MQVPGRILNGGDYRYGFQGQEGDPEIKGQGNSWNYKYRMHDPRIGRFFAVDPLTAKYPYMTPYQFSHNQPIHAPELEGLESANPIGPTSHESGNPDGVAVSSATKSIGQRLYEWLVNTDSQQKVEDVARTLTPLDAVETLDKHNRGETVSTEEWISAGTDIVSFALLAYGGAEGRVRPKQKTYSPTPAPKPVLKNPKAGTVKRIGNPKSYLDKALGRQGLNKPSSGLKETWVEEGYKYEVRIHPADTKYGKSGDVYRVGRSKQGVDANGQGYGWEYMDSQGDWHHTSTLKPGKGGNVNPNYNSQAAQDTHIEVPKY